MPEGGQHKCIHPRVVDDIRVRADVPGHAFNRLFVNESAAVVGGYPRRRSVSLS